MWVHVIREQVIKIDVLTFGNLGADLFRQRRQCAHVWRLRGRLVVKVWDAQGTLKSRWEETGH